MKFFVDSFARVDRFAHSSLLCQAHDILINLDFCFVLCFARVFRLSLASVLHQLFLIIPRVNSSLLGMCRFSGYKRGASG